MADDGAPIGKASAFWGPILLSARVHATTAEVWSAIKGYAQSQGVEVPPGMFSEVNRMRALATSLRTSGETLARANESDAITSRMIGTQLYARNALERSLAPAYHIRFELTTQTEAGPSTSWYTLEYEGSLPATVGDLRYDVGTYAQSLAGTYGTAVMELGDIEVGEF